MIRDLDPAGTPEPRLRAVHAVASAFAFGHVEGDEPMPFEEWVAEERRKATFLDLRHVVAEVDGEVVGHGYVELDAHDNPHLGWAGLAVLPSHRRRGIGTQLLDRLTRLAADDGRASFGVSADQGSPGAALAAMAGLTHRQWAHQNRLLVADVDADLLRTWVAQAPERAGDYSLRTWDGPTPEPLVEAFAACTQVMNTAPMDDLDVEDERMTPDRLRVLEAARVEANVDWWTACAVHEPTGALAGFTQLSFSGWRPSVAKQNDTGVDPAHRDRGLGRWLKASMLLRLLEEKPRVERIDTWNAGSNEPMLGINHALGFRRVRVSGNWQGDLDVVRKHFEERVG